MRYLAMFLLLFAEPVAAQPVVSTTVEAGKIIDGAVTPGKWAAIFTALAPTYASTVVAILGQKSEFRPTFNNIAAKKHGGIPGFEQMLAEEYRREMLARFPQYRQAFVDYLVSHMTPAEIHDALAQPDGAGRAKLRLVASAFEQLGRETGRRLGQDAGQVAAEHAIARATS